MRWMVTPRWAHPAKPAPCQLPFAPQPERGHITTVTGTRSSFRTEAVTLFTRMAILVQARRTTSLRPFSGQANNAACDGSGNVGSIPVSGQDFLYFATVDGTFARIKVNTADGDDWTLNFPDGRQVKNKVARTVNNVPETVQRVSDHNGNSYDWFSVTDTGTGVTIATIIDDMSRVITLTKNSSQDTVYALGADFPTHTPLTWTIKHDYVSSTLKYLQYGPGYVDAPGFVPGGDYRTEIGSTYIVSEIDLPPEIGGGWYKFDFGNAGGTTAGSGALRHVTTPNSGPDPIAEYWFSLDDCVQPADAPHLLHARILLDLGYGS